uniref:Protein LBH n=1 Tax=Oryzias sinensis TaxID=183150 RepID=A0A8C8DPF9_9TELE
SELEEPDCLSGLHVRVPTDTFALSARHRERTQSVERRNRLQVRILHVCFPTAHLPSGTTLTRSLWPLITRNWVLNRAREKAAQYLVSRLSASPVFVPSSDMTEVMISSTPMEDMRLSPSKDRLSFQIFPDPSDFDRCCKLKDRLPSIVVEPTEGEVESGELRWPPEEFLVSEEEEEEEDDQNSGSLPNGQPVQNSQH